MASETSVKDRDDVEEVDLDDAETIDSDSTDTDTDSATTDSETTDTDTESAAGRRRRWVLSAVGVLIVGLIAAVGFFGYHYFADPSDSGDSDRVAVASIADDYATKLASFDYRDLDKNRDAITAMSTEAFAAKYQEMVGALTEIVSNGQGVATAKVTHSAVAGIDGDTATVLAFVDQLATNVVAPEGKNQPYRMVLTLKRDGDRWLVDDVQTV